MNEYQIDYRMGNLADDNAIKTWLGNQKNNVRSIDDYTFDETNQLMGLKKDGYMFYFNVDGTEQEVEIYNIAYFLDGGTNEENAVESYSKGDTIQLPVPTKDGAQFLGWSMTQNDSENTISNITSDMEGDLTLYACWINELPENYFTYSTDGTGITGFDVDGTAAYNSAQEMDLVFPSKHKVNNNDVTITSISGFNGRTKIKKLVIPDTITTIASNTFSGCTGIKYLKIPISITSAEGAFGSVTNIEELYLSKGTGLGKDYNGSYQYSYLRPWGPSKEKITKLKLEKGIIKIGKNAFIECSNINVNWSELINSREELTTIGECAFEKCKSIAGELEIPINITSINKSVFSECEGITRLIIQDTTTSIGQYAFSGCTGIKYLKIPISITSADGAFGSVTNIEELYVSKGTGVGKDYSFDYTYYNNIRPWGPSIEKITKLTLERGITKIGNNAFRECSKVNVNWSELINSREELTTIGECAFGKCKSIGGELEIPSSITSINKSVFSECEGITRLIIQDTTTSIGQYAFSGCTGIKYLKIPISITSADGAFESVTNIEELYLSKGTGLGKDYNGSYQYSYIRPWGPSKEKITKLTLEKGITQIGNNAFIECANISNIKFTGTQTEWNAITIGSNNTILSTVTVECEN